MFTEIIAANIGAKAVLWGAITGGIIGLLTTLVSNLIIIKNEESKHKREKKEEAYTECAKFLIELNTNKDNMQYNVEHIATLRTNIEIYGSRELSKEFQGIAENIMETFPVNKNKMIMEFISKVRQELNIYD